MVNEIVLSGCKTRPLASYLKAIATLRLISEQGKDPDAKGYWKGEAFAIQTCLTKEALETFFCHEYSPTPIVAPWNGGSGFNPGDALRRIEAIARSVDSRFASYREVIGLIKSWPEMPRDFEKVGDIEKALSSALAEMQQGKTRDEVARLLDGIQPSTPLVDELGGKDPYQVLLVELESQSEEEGEGTFKNWWKAVKKARTKCFEMQRADNKDIILSLCRSRLPESSLQWLDAVCALHPDGRPFFNPLLGTGGNDANLEFSNNFMRQVWFLLLKRNTTITRDLLFSALFGTVFPGLPAGRIGQYDPGQAGGFNQSTGIESPEFVKVNPWDYVLMLEGTILFSSALVRQSQAGEIAQISSPFTVDGSPVGFTSSEHSERGRKETWFPLWRNPATCSEVKYLFGEGRCQLGTKQVRTGLDFSLALGALGVDRGIEAFERYAFLKRRGDSYVALPAGKRYVRYRKNIEYLTELDQVLSSLDWFLSEFKKDAPASFLSARRRIDEALFACTKEPSAQRFSDLVCSLGRLEKLVAMRDRKNKPSLQRPLSGLSPEWIILCDDRTPEVRIAGAIASIQATGKVGPIRSNIAGVDPAKPWKWGAGNTQSTWIGNTLSERLGHILVRRVMDAERFLVQKVPLEGRLHICPQDVMSFLLIETDDVRMEELLWGFLLIDWRKNGVDKVKSAWKDPLEDYPISRTWALLKLLNTPEIIRGKAMKKEPRVAYLLGAGRTEEACKTAIFRLRVSELKPFDVVFEEDLEPARLLSSLLIPTNNQWKLEALVLRSETKVT